MPNALNLAKAFRLTPGDVIAFVGGGGKTTAMFHLAAELAGQNLRVLTTTSTRIFAAQIKQSPAHVTFNPHSQTLDGILPKLNAAVDAHGQVLLVGRADPHSGKAFGLPPETVDALAGHFDFVLNEADGSRMRPFKAPAAHEPVIPVSTSLVVPVVGLDVLGQPLTEDTVHRAGIVNQLSQTPWNASITPQTVAEVLSHPQGGLKNVPARARVIPLLNKANAGNLSQAQTLAAKLLAANRLDSVVIGAVQTGAISEVWTRPALVVLAAGGSTRFGNSKQLALWQGQTLLERAVDVALESRVGPVVVVLGASAQACRAALGNRPVQMVVNSNWAQGQSSSMQAGLAALAPNIGSALFLLVDQPGITPEIINALVRRHRQTLAPVIWPEFEGKRGNPVLFDRSLFTQLAQVSGDTGGRPVLLAHKDQGERVVVDTNAVLMDIDSPQDLRLKDEE